MSDNRHIPEIDQLVHGIESACYRGGPGEPYYLPAMDCMCGFSTGRCESWEEAGRILDVHFAEKKR